MKPIEFAGLFEEFRAPSWRAWREILALIGPEVRELYVVAGRGSGKSRIVGLLGACFGARKYRRAPGELIFVGVFGPSRAQAELTHRYIVGLLRSVPELAALIVSESAERVELVGGVVIEVITATKAAPRGRAYALVIVEEAAFLPQDDSANPDVELVRAVRPGLARVAGSLLCVVSSPYARRGILWDAARKYAQGDPTGRVVFVQRPTLDLNPTFDRAAVETALAEDPAGAAAEYLAEFRSDVESYVSGEAVAACIVVGRRELPPVARTKYEAFVDPSGGSADSFTLAIGHSELRGDQPVAIVDCTRERKAPFSPEAVVAELAAVLKTYRVSRIFGDRYAGEWPREAFKRHGITYEPAEKPKSDLYRDALAIVNAGRVELLDDARLVAQLVALERRTSRGGRDSIDHPPGQHDDLCNVVCGLAVRLAVSRPRARGGVWGFDAIDDRPVPATTVRRRIASGCYVEIEQPTGHVTLPIAVAD